MEKTTLCYLEKDGKYLMLFRNKKQNDLNKGKWIGVGGHLEEGETPDECVVREVKEETGFTLKSFVYRGTVNFRQGNFEEVMYLYTSDDFEGQEKSSCNEGELKWIKKDEIMKLPLWEGDKYFLRALLADRRGIEMTLVYEGDKVVLALDN